MFTFDPGGLMFKSLRTMAVAAAGLVATAAWSANYQFDVVYSGGGVATLAPGSQDPLEAVLQPGDTFTWTISALGDNQWTVLNGGNVFPMMAMAVEESAYRTSNFQFDLLNDGQVVLTTTELASVQSLVHMGTNDINLPTGLVFDRWELQYTLISTVEVTSEEDPENPGTFIEVRGGPTTTSPSSLLPIFGIVDNTLVANSSTTVYGPVPEPSTWALWLAGAAGLGMAARRRSARQA
jgi:PEP-CTERM motif